MNALTDTVILAPANVTTRPGLTHPDALRRAAQAAGISYIGLTYARDNLRWLLRPTRGKSLSFLALAYRSDHQGLKRLAGASIRMVGNDLRRATRRELVA